RSVRCEVQDERRACLMYGFLGCLGADERRYSEQPLQSSGLGACTRQPRNRFELLVQVGGKHSVGICRPGLRSRQLGLEVRGGQNERLLRRRSWIVYWFTQQISSGGQIVEFVLTE